MQDNSDLIIRDCCEAEAAEFGKPDTICITVDVLREIVQRHFPGTCLHQIQEPAAAEQAAWHASLDEGRAQATGSVSNATSQPAPAAVTATASPTFMTADQGRDWAWNNVREYVGTEGWTVMDSVNFHGFFLYGWNYRGQYELQRTAAVAAVKQELTAAPVAAGKREDMQDMVSKALTTAWQLGQAFWRQADSVRHTQHVKSEQTERDFEALIESTRAALAATPAAAPVANGYDSGIQTGNRVTLIFETQDAATAWFESFSDAYDTENGTRSIALPIPISTTQAAAAVDKSPELQGSVVDKTVNLQDAAAAPVVLPEPDAAIKEVMTLVELHRQEIIKVMDEEGSLVDVQSAQDAIEAKLRALLATATGLPAQAVPAFSHVASLKLKSLQERGYQITGYALEKPVEGAQPERGFINHGGFVGWWWDGQSPQAQADARDAVLAHLAGLLDDAAAHIYPSDLNKFQTGEHTATVASVRMGNSSECSVPLYSREQVVEAFNANRAAQGEEA